MMNNGGWGMGFGGGLYMLVILTMCVLLAFFLIRYFVTRNDGRPRQSDTPMDILKKRYANGEISTEDFNRMKRDL